LLNVRFWLWGRTEKKLGPDAGRHPAPPKGQPAEPLLTFPSGALVHFAVSNSEVYMTTKLEGPATTFLPFNKGENGGKGNPVNPEGGHPTAVTLGIEIEPSQ
jgi:hypothetical protein